MNHPWSEGKPSVPLIPKSEQKYNHDSSHVLRKVFQDILEEPTLPENVVHNWATYNIDSIEDKAAALDILAVMEKSKLQREDINIVEQKLNVNLVQHKTNQKAKHKESRGLPYLTFPKIDQEDAVQYGLITAKDLLPSRIDQSLGAPGRDHIDCILCTCPSLEKMNFATQSRTKLPKIHKTSSERGMVSPGEMHRWKEICRLEKDPNRVSKAKLAAKMAVDSANFKLDKNKIVFGEYEAHVIYKKRFRLQNISNKRLPVPLDANQNKNLSRCFEVKPEFEPELILSPGLSATFTVYFRTSNFLDVQDEYEVCGHKIKLVSYRKAPQLALFVLRNTWPMRPIVHTKFDVGRAQALNDTIEIGSCFVGESFESYLIIKNNGGYGKFFFMTELHWITQNIDTMKSDLKLDFGSFTIEPNYFELRSGEYIIVKVNFYGETSNTCIENLLLVCNNINWISIDFIADVIIFDKYTITCEGDKMTEFFTSMLKEPIHAHNQSPYQLSFCDDLQICSETRFHNENLNTQVRISVSSAISGSSINTQGRSTLEKETMASADSTIDLHSFDYCSDDVIQYLLEQESLKTGGPDDSEEGRGPTSPHLINFGNTLGYNPVKQTVAIHNNSMIHLRYRWEFRETNTSWYPIQVREINSEWVKFRCDEDVIPAYGTVEFGLILKPDTNENAYHCIGLSLIIEDIPRCAIRLDPRHPNFMILDQVATGQDCDVTPVVDVQVSLFDAICFVDTLKFQFEPKNIFGSHFYERGITIKQKFTMVVNCCSQKELSGSWITNELNSSRVLVTPEHFVCTPGIPISFDAEVKIENHHLQHEIITVVVDSNFKESLNLKILVERPHLHFSRSSLNLGTLLVGNTYQRSFMILNANNANVDWEIREQYQKDLDRGDQNRIVIQARNLSCGDVEVTYRVITGAPVKWHSFLLLYITSEDQKLLDSKIVINYEIVDIPICVHSSFSACPILSPESVLFVSSPSTFKLCFHNLTKTNMTYETSSVYGDHAEFLDISFSPRRFQIAKRHAKRIDVTITPSKAGIFDDIYLAFKYVDDEAFRVGELNPPPPLVVTLLVAVDDISVRLTLPKDKCGHQTEITWPPNLDLGFIDRDESRECGEESPVTGAPNNSIACIDGIHSEHPLPIDIFQYFKDLEDVEEGTSARESSALLSSFTSDTTTTTYKTETTCWKFGEDSHQEKVSYYVIEMAGVPLRQLVQCSIKLENLTPVPGVLQIDTVYFPAKKYHKKRIDAVLEKLNYITVSDEWDNKIGPHGLAIAYSCLDGAQEIKPFGTNEIILSIYANTWGLYKEQISIDFNNILPLRISLLVEVVGIPLEFPIGVNNIHKTTILRFGILAYKSDFEVRNLQIKNTSVIPINVNWHIFMRHTHEELAKDPITILFDISHPHEEDLDEDEPTSQGNLMIAHGKIVGKSDTKIFKMSPKESLIQAQEIQTLQIGLNPSAYATSFSSKDIEAYLIGYPQLPERYRTSNLFKRPVGHDLQPIKAKLTASLELPTLHLDMTPEDHHVVMYADKIIKEKSAKQIKLLTFKNFHRVEAAVKFNILPPFFIESAQICGEPMAYQDEWYLGVVPPAEAATLKIGIKMDSKEVIKISTSVYDRGTYVDYFVPSQANVTSTSKFDLVKDLHIEQKGFLRQNIPMSLSLYFPMLEVPSKLDFGETLIDSVTKELLILKNYSACAVEFSIKPTETFRTSPEKGVIPPGRPKMAMIFDLSVIFIPQAHQKYQENLIIQTQIPCLSFKIDIAGFGRYDEAFYKPDTC